MRFIIRRASGGCPHPRAKAETVPTCDGHLRETMDVMTIELDDLDALQALTEEVGDVIIGRSFGTPDPALTITIYDDYVE